MTKGRGIKADVLRGIAAAPGAVTRYEALLAARKDSETELAEVARTYRGPGHPWSEDEAARVAKLARGFVARALVDALAGVPCFCTPDRPELGRPDWCVRHLILDRVKLDTVTTQLLMDLGDASG